MFGSVKRFLLILCLLVGLQLHADTTNIIYTTTWDFGSGTYILRTNYLTSSQYLVTTYVTNYTGMTSSPGTYVPVYTSVWNPATFRYELTTNFIKLKLLSTNVTISITGPAVPPPGPPVMTNFTLSTSQNVPLTFDPGQWSLDTNGVPAITQYAVAGYGTVANNITNLVYAPAWAFVGTDTVHVVITDRYGSTNGGVITILVTNIPPYAYGVHPVFGIYRHTYNTYALPLYTNTSRIPLHLTNAMVQTQAGTNWVTTTNASVQMTNLTLTLRVDKPPGTTRVTYAVTDGFGSYTDAMYGAVAYRPFIVTNFSASVLRNTTNNLDVLAQAFSPDGDALSIVSAVSTNGTVAFGNYITYVPSPGFSGNVPISYTLTDGYATNAGLVTVYVNSLSPVMTNYTVSAMKYASATTTVTNHAYSPYGVPLSIDSITATNCTAMATKTAVTTAATVPAYVGVVLTDGSYHFGSGTITIIPTNAVVATNGTVSTMVNHSVSFNPRAYSYSTDGDPTVIYSYSGVGVTGTTNGTLTLTPATNTVSTNTLTYAVGVADGMATNTGTITLVVTNIPPHPNNYVYTIYHDTIQRLVLRGTNSTLMPVTVTITGVTNGTVTTVNGTNYYNPTAGFVGTGYVATLATDVIGGTGTGFITINVQATPAPVAPVFTPTDILMAQTNGYLWPAGVPVVPGMTTFNTWFTNLPSPVVVTNYAYSPVGLPLTLLTNLTLTNCAAMVTNGAVAYRLTAGSTNASIGYTVSDGFATNSGVISIPYGPATDWVVGWSNGLHTTLSGVITITGYSLAGSVLSLGHQLPYGPVSYYYPAGVCPALVTTNTDVLGTSVTVTWPNTYCAWNTSWSLMVTNNNWVNTLYYVPSSAPLITLTNNYRFIP
jgi:Bacterial Ig domain